jgi:pimeloyl-ACP methyl ester carboxylesterase
MARLVLVHGAFGGAWWWDRVVEPLEAAGHTVERFDLPGAGDDPTPAAEVTLDAYVERVAKQLAESEEPAVLVGHSMGGVVVTQTAARNPDRVEKVVYVCAFVPADGQSLLDLTQLPEGADDQIQANIVVEGDPPVGRMPKDAARTAEFGECSEEDFEWAIERHGSQPVAPFGQPVSIPEGVFDPIPRRYVFCTRDNSIPPPLQRRMVEAAGITETAELDTDHAPSISRTEELVEAIDRLAS